MPVHGRVNMKSDVTVLAFEVSRVTFNQSMYDRSSIRNMVALSNCLWSEKFI